MPRLRKPWKGKKRTFTVSCRNHVYNPVPTRYLTDQEVVIEAIRDKIWKDSSCDHTFSDPSPCSPDENSSQNIGGDRIRRLPWYGAAVKIKGEGDIPLDVIVEIKSSSGTESRLLGEDLEEVTITELSLRSQCTFSTFSSNCLDRETLSLLTDIVQTHSTQLYLATENARRNMHLSKSLDNSPSTGAGNMKKKESSDEFTLANYDLGVMSFSSERSIPVEVKYIQEEDDVSFLADDDSSIDIATSDTINAFVHKVANTIIAEAQRKYDRGRASLKDRSSSFKPVDIETSLQNEVSSMISPRAAAYTDIDEPLPEMQQHFTYFDYCQKEELSKEGIIDTLKESVVRTSKQTFSANQAAPNKDQIISSFSNKVRSKLSGGTQWKNGVMVEGEKLLFQTCRY